MASFVRQNFLIIGFILFSIGISGCTTNNSESAQMYPVGEGFKDVTTEPLQPISMDEAISILNSSQVEPYQIRYIRGEKIDSNGMAQQWIFGVKQKNINRFFICDNSGMTSVPWMSWIPANEIFINEIVPPDKFFSINSLTLSDYYNRDIAPVVSFEIIDDEYILTFQTGEFQETLRFDSQTGIQKK